MYLEKRGIKRFNSLPPSRGNTGSRLSTAKKRFISSLKIRYKIRLITGPAVITIASLAIERLQLYLSAMPKKEIFKQSGLPPTASNAHKCPASCRTQNKISSPVFLYPKTRLRHRMKIKENSILILKSLIKNSKISP